MEATIEERNRLIEEHTYIVDDVLSRHNKLSDREDIRQQMILMLIEGTDYYLRKRPPVKYKNYAYFIMIKRINDAIPAVLRGCNKTRQTFLKADKIRVILEETPYENNETIAKKIGCGVKAVRTARFWIDKGMMISFVDPALIDHCIDSRGQCV